MKEFLQELEDFSKSKIKQVYDFFETNEDIRWFTNEMCQFDDENITPYYINNEYGKKTRWDLWIECINILKERNVKSLIDIGTGNGHFVFLCLKHGIKAYGVEPRISAVESTQHFFVEHFGEKKIFVGNLGTFLDFFETKDFKVDCLSILNFLHGANHKSAEIIKMSRVFPKIAQYLLCSEPRFNEIGIENVLMKFNLLKEGIGYENIHNLYSLGK